MNDTRDLFRILLVAMILPCAFARANEVSWMAGTSAPQEWAIEPVKATDTEVIAFSGPVRTFLNLCVAEQSLGGQPTLVIDAPKRTVQLTFVPPAREDCSDFLDPVSGLEGFFGPLEAGSWEFSCHQKDVTFSLSFDVTRTGEAPDQDVYYVDVNARGNDDGTSWADAFVHLQTALGAATEAGGGEIRVAKGIYRPDQSGGYAHWNPYVAFHLTQGIVLKGGYAGSSGPNPNDRDVVAYETILSGDLGLDDQPLTRPSEVADDYTRADNCFHVVVTSGTDSTTVLDGLTITGGHAFTKESPYYETRVAEICEYGGGIYNDQGSPIIRNCIITGNGAASFGGGIYNRGLSTPTLIDCTISDNWSEWWGGGVLNDSSSNITLTRCAVTGNAAMFRGGGIATRNNAVVTISNCIITGNSVFDSKYGQGGGFYCLGGTAVLNHCTMAGNRGILGAAVFCDSLGQSAFSSVQMGNSIVWDHEAPFWCADQSMLEVTYSDVEGRWSGVGNIATDPCLVEAGYWFERDTADDLTDDVWYDGDYRLKWNSPCIDAGDPHEAPDAGEVDFYGNPRLAGAVVDMGAYELRNELPVAIAGPDVAGFTLDGRSGTVTLDGSASYDPEAMPLTYRWYRDGKPISREATFEIELPVGETALTLIVSDGANDSEPDTVIARIYEVIDTWISVPETILRAGGRDTFVALIRLPNKRPQRDFDNTDPLLLFPGGVPAIRHTLFTWLSGHSFVFGTFRTSDFMAAVPEDGPVEVRIVGRLKDGHYFSGTEMTRVK